MIFKNHTIKQNSFYICTKTSFKVQIFLLDGMRKREIAKLNNIPTSPNPSKGGESCESPTVSDTNNLENRLPGYVTADLQNYKYIKEFRVILKENPTEAEKLIWEYLKNKKIDYKIRRQHVIDNFIVDFVCLPKKVVIEIDGGIHLQQQESDLLRTNTLNEQGFMVIRFSNEEVLSNPENVALKIKEVLDNRIIQP